MCAIMYTYFILYTYIEVTVVLYNLIFHVAKSQLFVINVANFSDTNCILSTQQTNRFN